MNEQFECIVINGDNEYEMSLTIDDFNNGVEQIKKKIAQCLEKKDDEISLERMDIIFRIEIKEKLSDTNIGDVE